MLAGAGCATSKKDKDLGYLLVSVSEASGTITAQDMYPLREGTWSWRVTAGDDAGRWVERRREETDLYHATWLETHDGDRREYWSRDDQGNLVMTAVAEPRDQAISFFDPPLVIAYKTLGPGESRRQQVTMRVMDLRRPERMKDQGLATRTVEYVDDRLIQTPLGTMPTRRVEISFRADLRLARAENSTTVLVYPTFGIVVERREDTVTLLGIRLRHREQTLALVRMPEERGAGAPPTPETTSTASPRQSGTPPP